MKQDLLTQLTCVAVAGVFLALAHPTNAAVTVVEDGSARATIVTAAEPSDTIRKAAAELQVHIRKMSGADLTLVEQGSTQEVEGVAIRLGDAADAGLEALIREKGEDPGAFALVVTSSGADIRGLSDEGTLYGAYELLEQLGVRWFMAGELGTIVPELTDVVLAEQSTVQVPSFHARWQGGGSATTGAWRERVRLGGPYFPPAHGVHLPKGCGFVEHPEYYALISGERKKRQLCVSNPDVVKGAIESTRAFFRKNPDRPWIGLGPNDGRGYCECEKCTALDGGDWDPFAAHMSMTDRYVWFFNQILEGIADEFPDKKLCFYSYASYNRPPVKETPNPRIVPAFAPITLCRIHGLGNPVCPEKNCYQRWIIQEWGKIIPEVFDRGYWFNLADPGLLFPMVHRVRTQIPISHELGITGWRVETLVHWASESPSLYIAAKLMWDHEADVDALMRDFCEKSFGDGADAMLQYFTMIDSAVRDADFHTGCSFDIPNLYPPELRKRANKLLKTAQRKADRGPCATRARVFAEGFSYTEAFIDMMEKRAVHDWTGAKAALGRMDELRDILTAYDPPMVSEKYSKSYMKRFFRPCTDQGFERVGTDKGSLVAGLDDEWEFKIDPEGLGESLKWFDAELTGGNWRRVKTSSLSWSDQGLRHYKGGSWYRQRVRIDPEWEGRKVLIWFGGVDEKAKVWVNGTLLGESPGRAFVPFEMDVGDSLLSGSGNLVVVAVQNAKLNEVGTGGITAPVMFWAPAKQEQDAAAPGEDVTPVEFR